MSDNVVKFSTFGSPEAYGITMTPRHERLIFSVGDKEMLILLPDGTMQTGEGIGRDEATQAVAKQLANHYAQEAAARIEQLERERDEWRKAFEEDGRDARYFAKAMSAQQRAERLQERIGELERDLADYKRQVDKLEDDANEEEARADALARENERLREALRNLLPLARNDRYLTQEPEVEDAEALIAPAATQGETK